MNRMMPVFVAGLFLATVRIGFAQTHPLRFKQARDDVAAVPITSAEFAELGDPLFNLVLKEKADLTKLTAIVDALQSDPLKRQLFVVDEQIVSDRQPGSRRSVIAFLGTNGGELLEQNVMLSAFFDDQGFDDVVDLEAWGWDNKRLRYNYYKLDQGGVGPGTPATPFWKFRATSLGAETLTGAQRTGTCLRCHVSGAPVMKELFFPWNNWHAGVGGTFIASYLDKNSPGHWPAAEKPFFKTLAQANLLEDDQMLPTFQRFAKARLLAATKLDSAGQPAEVGGKRRITEGRRLLKSVFETTDVNLYSSTKMSGNHPFDPAGGFSPAAPLGFPRDQFFLNTNLIAGDGEGSLAGLEISEAREFFNFAKPTQQENKDIPAALGVKLFGQAGRDTKFAMLVPGQAYVDNALVSEALQQGAVTPHFLASILAVDLETPVFSDRRKGLLTFIPDEYDYSPVDTLDVGAPHNPADDELTAKTIAAIDAASPPAGSPADEFRTLLKSADAVAELKTRVKAYVARVKAKLDTAPANAANRKAELERLYKIIVVRRQVMEAHPILGNLDETGRKGLLPLP